MGTLTVPVRARTSREAHVVAMSWCAVAMAVRIAWLAHRPAIATWDGAIYHRTAVRLAAGLGFVDTWNDRPPYHPTAFYPVGYPAALGFLYRLFGAHAWVAGMLNVLSAGVCALLISHFARRASGRLAGHLAPAFFAFTPGAVVYTSAFMTEPLSAALLTASLGTAIHHARTGRLWSACATGILLGAGGLVRPPALLIAPVIAVCATPAWSPRAIVRVVAVVGIACACVVLPWTARNCCELDGCALVSVNGGSNLWIGADPEAHGGYRDLRHGEGCDRVFGEVAKDRCYMARAVARIRSHPWRWLALAPEKMSQLLAFETTPVSYLRSATGGEAFATTADAMYRMMTAVHRMLLLLALAGSLPARGEPRRSRVIRVVTGAVLALAAVHVVFFGVDRYHFVFTPLVCLLAASAFRRPRTVRGIAAMGAPGAVEQEG